MAENEVQSGFRKVTVPDQTPMQLYLPNPGISES